MTKSKRNLIIALAVIAALLIAIAVVINIDTDDRLPESSGNDMFYTVYSENANNITSVEITGGEEDITAVNLGNSVWTIKGYTADEIDTSKAYGIAGTVSQLSSKHKIEENPSDLSLYGLDKPSLTVTVTKQNGDADILYIGEQSPTLGEYFIMKKDDNTVYTIYGFKVDTLKKPLSFYMEFDRFDINIDDIRSIKITRQDETIALKILDGIDENTNNVWEMTSPYQSGANDDYIDNKILAPIENIAMTTPVTDTDGGITDKSPSLVLTVKPYDNLTGKYGDEYTETMTVGNTVNKKTYVKYKEQLFAVDADSISFINESSFNLVSKLQALVDISKVRAVKLEYGGSEHTLSIGSQNSSYSFKLDGSPADRELSQTAYRAIISLAVDGIYDGAALGETVLTISYTGNKASDDTVVELRKIDDLNCALTRNGKTEFTIKTSKISELTDAFDEYIKNYK